MGRGGNRRRDERGRGEGRIRGRRKGEKRGREEGGKGYFLLWGGGGKGEKGEGRKGGTGIFYCGDPRTSDFDRRAFRKAHTSLFFSQREELPSRGHSFLCAQEMDFHFLSNLNY